MPIRADLLPLYGPDWDSISQRIRFERAQGRCEACGRPHRHIICVVADGRWIDPATDGQWRGPSGEPIGEPTIRDLRTVRLVRVVLTTAHLDHDPTNSADANLAAWCQRCHLAYDLGHHLSNRRHTLRARWALADLFDGPYTLAGYPGNAR
jgi:hypothetical protein